MKTFRATRGRWWWPAAASVSLVILACSGDGAGEPASTPEADVAPGRDGLIATATVLPAVSVPDDVPEGLEAVWEAYAQLTREYVDREELEVEAMAEGAIRGMIDAIDDRYTAYVSPENYTRQMESFRGDFEGIGAVIQNTPDGKRIVIVSPLDDTPAERAGLKSGDIIMAVDGDDTEGWSVIDAVTRIRGPKGTPVELLLQHIGEPEPVAVTIIRGTIETPSVSVSMLPDDPYAIVRISSFTDRTPDELEEALAEVREANAKGIILDMRANPGGMLAATVDVASEFLDGGLVTYEIDGRGARKDWNARSGGSTLDMPLVVLVDEFSASGSELLAAALQDRGRAAIIGTTTFGKGSVNILRDLEHAGGLYITIARFYSPNGTPVEGDGVTPDVVVEIPEDATEDVQLNAAIKQLDFQVGAAVQR